MYNKHSAVQYRIAEFSFALVPNRFFLFSLLTLNGRIRQRRRSLCREGTDPMTLDLLREEQGTGGAAEVVVEVMVGIPKVVVINCVFSSFYRFFFQIRLRMFVCF